MNNPNTAYMSCNDLIKPEVFNRFLEGRLHDIGSITGQVTKG